MIAKPQQRCPNTKKTIAIILALIMINSVFPIQNVLGEEYRINENEQIYMDLEELMEEKDKRYANEGDELWNDTQQQLNNMVLYDEGIPTIKINKNTPELRIPVEMPEIFEKLEEQFNNYHFIKNIINQTGLNKAFATLIDGRTYYIYANDSSGNEVWKFLANTDWSIGQIIDAPRIGYDFTQLKSILPLGIPTGLLKIIVWTYIDINGGGNDFRIALTVNLEDPYLESGTFGDIFQIPPQLGTPEVIIKTKVNIYLEIENLNNYPEATIYVGRPIQTDNPEQTFLWAVGIGFNNTYPNFKLTVSIDNFRLKLNTTSLLGILIGTIGGDLGNVMGEIYSINSPYRITIEHNRNRQNTQEDGNLTSFLIGQGRAQPQSNSIVLRENNYLFFGDVPYLPKYLYIFLDSVGWAGSLKQIAVDIGNSRGERTRVLNNLTFILYEDKHETNNNISYTQIFIEDIPSFSLNMTDIQDENGIYNIIELSAVQDMKTLQFKEWNYHYLNYTQLQDLDNLSKKDGIIESNEIVEYIYTDILVEELPKNLMIKGTFLSDIVLENRTAKSSDLISQIFESIMITIASEFYYLYKRARTTPLSIIELPTKTGWATISNDYGGELSSPIKRIKAIFTTDKYIEEEGDFFAYYNKKGGIGAVNTTFGWITGLSLQITNLSYFFAVFTEGTLATLRFKNNTNNFKLIYGEDYNYAVVEISNIPNSVSIDLKENNIRFITKEQRISKVVYKSYINKQTIRIIIDNVPNSIEIEREENHIKLNHPSDNTAQEFNIDFLITPSLRTIKRINGDHLLVYQDGNVNMISGRISGLRGFLYNSERGLYLDLNMRGGDKFSVYIKNETDIDDMLFLQGILYPMPSSFIIDLPKKMTKSEINISSLLDIGGLTDFGNLVYAINDLSTSILTMVNEASAKLFEEMTFLDSNMTFKYNSSENLNIIAKVLKGNLNEIGNLDNELSFTHGINLRKIDGNKVIIGAKVFLSNLPKKFQLTINSKPGDLYIDGELNDYSPKYDFLLIDIQGLMNMDAFLYLNKLGKNITISADVDLFTISGVGKTTIIGNLNFFITGENFTHLGKLYLRAKRTIDVPIIAEFFIEKIPSSLNLVANVQNDISVEYKSSEEIKYILFNLYKFINEKWYQAFILLNDLPTKVEFAMKSNLRFDMDEFLIIQGMPTITINTTSNTLGLYANIDGRVLGRRASFEIEGENITDNTKLYVENGIIKVRSSGKIGYINLRITNYPLSREYFLKSLTLHAERIQSIDIEIITLFGKYPLIKLYNAKSGKVQFDIQHTIIFNEIKFDAKVVLIHAMLDEGSGIDFPTVAPVQVNSFYTRTPSNTKHFIIIDPISTLMVSMVGK